MIYERAGCARPEDMAMITDALIARLPATPLATGDALELEGVTRTFGALRAIEDVAFRWRRASDGR